MKSSKINILVVDDEIGLLETISELFATFNFQVDTSISGSEAWTKFQKNHYDLVITDIRMPNGDGIELAKKIKSQKNKNETRLLFITGYSDQSVEEIYHLGAEGIFAKPFESSSVIKAMNICLHSKKSKWSQPPPEKIDFKLNKTGGSIEELESKKIVQFGRGGFSVSHNNELPSINSIVSFKIEITQTNPQNISGVGVVRWISQSGSIGIEILCLENSIAETYIQNFNDRIPYIPKGL